MTYQHSRFHGLGREVRVVNTELVVKPIRLRLDKLRGQEAFLLDLVHNPRHRISTKTLSTEDLDSLTVPFDALCPRKLVRHSQSRSREAFEMHGFQVHSGG